MRSYRFPYDDSFKAGLVSENPGSVNTQGFVRLVNLIPFNGALQYRPQPRVTSVFDVTTEIFKYGNDVMALSSTKIEQVNQPSGVTFTRDTLLAPLDTGVRWCLADYVDFGIISHCGSATYVGYLDKFGQISSVSPTGVGIPKAFSMTDVNGQLVVGGILSDFLNPSIDYTTFVAWSKIGSIDFTVDKTNEAGFHQPNIGRVLSVQKLGASFLALGNDGVGLYYPADQTFGYKKISEYGIQSAWNCCSSGDEVFFIDKRGVLRRVKESAAQNVEQLGYSWLFENKNCRMHWARGEEELRVIVDNTTTFHLNEFGMCQSSIAMLGEATFTEGFVQNYVCGAVDLGDAILELAPKNANVSGLKSITEIHLVHDLDAWHFGYVVAVKGNREFQSRGYRLSDLGLAVPNIVADIFKIGCTIQNYQTPLNLNKQATINSLSVQTVKVDGRFGRGFQQGQMPTGG